MSNCSEKISYSGKIINENSINYSKLSNKKEIINQIGQPSYIDPIENKYLYYSEKKIFKNFFDEKIDNRLILVFEFDSSDKVIAYNKYNLEDENQISLIKDTTPNNLIERGLLEKLFGGVGKSSLPNTSE